MSALSGFIVVDKPSGVTSFSVVSLVRRLSGVRRVGHAGTLDPLASGVLPVAIGQAARLIEYTDDAPKRYLASVRLGRSTDTYDADGGTTREGDASGITEGALQTALEVFVGEITQRPPPFSAIKVAGRPLYDYARRGTPLEAQPRTVHVSAITLRAFAEGRAELDVRCGKGTYIRSIAHDLGEALGCGAHLEALRRTETAGFSLDEAHSPDDLRRAASESRFEEVLLAPDRAVERRPAAIFGASRARDVLLGRTVPVEAPPGVAACRAYSAEGEFLAMLAPREGGLWRPEKVFATG